MCEVMCSLNSSFLGINIRTWVSICVKTGVSYRYGSLRYFLYKEDTIASGDCGAWYKLVTLLACAKHISISLFK